MLWFKKIYPSLNNDKSDIDHENDLPCYLLGIKSLFLGIFCTYLESEIFSLDWSYLKSYIFVKLNFDVRYIKLKIIKYKIHSAAGTDKYVRYI